MATKMSIETNNSPVEKSGKFMIGGNTQVYRLGFGAMRLTGPGIWGPPRDHDEAIRVLRRAVQMGVNFIDTADSYGPYISEELIHEALYPYPKDLVIATKFGLVRTGPNQWFPVGRPEYLRQEAEMSLRRLGVERIDLMQYHRPDPNVPIEEVVGLMDDLQREGKIHHIGLSNVSVEQIRKARMTSNIVTVQNRYSLAYRTYEDVLDYCEKEGIGFIPWGPIAQGSLARSGSSIEKVAKELDISSSRLAIAWLLRRSAVMLPIPGTSKVAHLEDNLAAATVHLSQQQFDELSRKA